MLEHQAVIGLGNPGDGYKNTRHNAGFLAVDSFCKRHRGSSWKTHGGFALCRVMLRSRKLDVLKPLTYMNLSGKAVRDYLGETGISPDLLVVVHDDLDLDPGRVKIKVGGGSGGHKGLESIILMTGDRQFTRVRIGIGKPAIPEMAQEYVLREPDDPKEREQFENGVAQAVDALEMLLFQGAIPAMNRYNPFSPGDNAPVDGDNDNRRG